MIFYFSVRIVNDVGIDDNGVCSMGVIESLCFMYNLDTSHWHWMVGFTLFIRRFDLF